MSDPSNLLKQLAAAALTTIKVQSELSKLLLREFSSLGAHLRNLLIQPS